MSALGVAPRPAPDFSDVVGQQAAVALLEEAAKAGVRCIVLQGPPGAGCTMLARRFAGILPALPDDAPARPFRAPHHTVSDLGFCGEIERAAGGLLFLDEAPEFRRGLVERIPAALEADPSLVVIASANPCPCGYLGHPSHTCTCSDEAVARYAARVARVVESLPGVVVVDVPALSRSQILAAERCETSADIRARVEAHRLPVVPLAGVEIPFSEAERLNGLSFATWAEAESALRWEARRFDAAGWGYRKTDFVLRWQDGHEYRGRLDLCAEHADRGAPLAEHVRGYCLRRSGRDEAFARDYAGTLAAFDARNPEGRAQCALILDRYALSDHPGAEGSDDV